MENTEKCVMLEFIVPSLNVSNNAKMVNGKETLNEIEKDASFGDLKFYRGMSIRNLNKTLSELSDTNGHISFYLISKSEKLIKDLEESEINLENYAYVSCYQSATLQGFIHVIFPLAIKNINKEREKNGKEKVKSLDELKNNNNFNDTVIDTIKEILYIHECGNGGIYKDGKKTYQAKELFELYKPKGGGGQGPNNIGDIKENHDDLAKASLENDLKTFWSKIQQAPPKKKTYNISFESIKPIEININTIVSEIMRFKVEGDNKWYGNLVLKFTESDLNDNNLDICKLIRNCPQIKINNFQYRKITETSDMIFMITDRIEYEETIRNQFKLYEQIYLDNSGGYFYYSNFPNYQSTLFELKFVIFHSSSDEYSGHYVAYCKIKEKWHIFNDLDNDYAEYEEPPLINNTRKNYYPVAFYYVKNKQ